MPDLFCKNELENEAEKKGMNINHWIVPGIFHWR